ncbi:glycosyltransferase family 2 protein [Solwaraspora sp. WMMD406]|uniref:glycosyltransferase family 2 protein n=1 Tax=Solwaraspora sp. WMMD406 TaxID=3016095 RepID=UPI00241602B6|nr:glycosyltransferase family 2 protein [Solwaraspora sp. WMMD406]MDG4763485.1 glycosyltransferase family 2 protein [Solwaraspora sp. WMMD406]
MARSVRNDEVEVTVLLPCLNEAETLEVCIRKARGALADLGVVGEVLVSDNGSTDGSQEIAVRAGARVSHAPVRGYGGALINGIEQARGKFVIMADADDSYDLSKLESFIYELRRGHDVVMGNRFQGGIAPGAMPFLHRYLGNPVLSWLGRRLFGLKVGDFHCGIRGFNRDRVRELQLCMPGMEFASELVVRAALNGYDIIEVPTTLSPDGRSRPPHLRTWRDGWRHLRFLLVLAPRKLLIWPGATVFLAGLVGTVVLVVGPLIVGGIGFDVSTLVYTCLAMLVGAQLLLFGAFAVIYGRYEGITNLRQADRWSRFLRLETCTGAGVALVLVGLAGTVLAVGAWGAAGFGAQNLSATLRVVLPASTAIGLGATLIFAGLFSSLLSLRRVSAAVVDRDVPSPSAVAASPSHTG